MKPALLFELHHLGDAVLSVPFLRGLLKKKSGEVHVICRAGSVPVFRQFLPAGQIHRWEPWWELRGAEKIASLRALLGLLRELRALRPTCAFSVWADSRVHWLMRRTGAPNTVGFPVNRANFYAHERPWRRRRMWLGQVLGRFAPLSHPLQRRDYQQAHLTDWEQIAEAAELPWEAASPWFTVTPHPEVATFLRSEEKLWLIHPGGRLPTKRWPIDRFQTLLDTTFRDRAVLLIQPPDSPALVSTNPLHRSFAPRDFEELLALVQAADFVLCNDSLVSHLAAAQGKPVWTIFGSGNPNWFAPVRNEERVIAGDICRFRPCIDRCVHRSPICLEDLTVAQVAARLFSDV